MQTVLAIMNPWVVFAKYGRLGSALLCLLLQLTLLGWIPAAAWAVRTHHQEAAKPRRLTPFNIVPAARRAAGV